MPVTPGAESFAYPGSDPAGPAVGPSAGPAVGIVLCHGFTGTPASMRAWAAELAAAGYLVRCPRLPGHGTRWQELNSMRWHDWYARVAEEVKALTDRCDSVFVFGQSMGGTLALRAAQEFGDEIAGIALVNPSVMLHRVKAALLPVVSRIVPSVPGLGGDIAKAGAGELTYPRVPLRAAASLSAFCRNVRAELARVHQPVLLLHSRIDHVVDPANSTLVAARVSSTEVTDIVLPDSFHVATLDYDAPLIFSESNRFIIKHARVDTPV